MEEIASIITPEVQTAISTLIAVAVAYLIAKLRSLEKHEKEWKEEETVIKTAALAAPVPEAGTFILMENEYQTAEGMQKMVDAIPRKAQILKVDEGITSNGSKYRAVYWRVKIP